jgi:hypothetical protein
MLRIFSIQSLLDDTDFTMSFFLVLNFERHRSVFYTGVLGENKELQWRHQVPPCFKLVFFFSNSKLLLLFGHLNMDE